MAREKMAKERQERLLRLIPEQYHQMITNHNWNDRLLQVYDLLSPIGRLCIEKIVPACLEEIINLKASDLLVDNLSGAHTGYTDAICAKNLCFFKRVDTGSTGYSLDTEYLYEIGEHHYFSGYKGNKGFHLVYSDNKDWEYKDDMLTRFADIDNSYSDRDGIHCYHDLFIFKIRTINTEKVKIDKPSLELLKTLLTEEEFKVAEENFEKEDSDGKIVGEVA